VRGLTQYPRGTKKWSLTPENFYSPKWKEFRPHAGKFTPNLASRPNIQSHVKNMAQGRPKVNEE